MNRCSALRGAGRVIVARVRVAAGLPACAAGAPRVRKAARTIGAAAVALACAVAAAQTGPAVRADASASAPAAAAATPAPVPLEVFFAQPQVLQAELSPSGRRLALTTARGATRVGLVVFDLAGPVQARRVAQFADIDVRQFAWVDDERLVFSVIDLDQGSGSDYRAAPGLFAVDADGSDLRSLIERRVNRVVDAEPARRRALPWNHVLLHVPRRAAGTRGDEVVIGALDFRAGELQRVRPMRLDVRSGRTRHLDLRAPENTVGWLFDAEGQARVAVTRDEGRRAVHWRAPGRDDWQRLADAPEQALPFLPQFVDGGDRLAVSVARGPGGRAELAHYDFERRAPSDDAWVRVEGFDFAGAPVVGDDGRTLGLRIEGDAETTAWFDEGLQRLQAEADRRLPGRVNRISCRRCGTADQVALVRSWSDRDPGELWLVRPPGDRWQMVARVMPEVDAARSATVDLHRIRARDGHELPVWVTRPAGVPRDRPAPAVVLVHGGPWVRGGHWRFEPLAQFLASRGYLVVSPDFRGSRGYGSAHFRAGWKQWGRAMQDDVADALLWARRQGLADDRACIAGASYGGYATLMGLVRHPELYRCGIAWVAVTDLLLTVEGSIWVDDDTDDATRRYTLPQLIGDPKTEADALKAVSPVEQAGRIRAPLLLAFGESDRRVPFDHGTRLRDALRKAGREPEWISYPDEGHGWRAPQTQRDFARRIEQFLARHLDPVAR